MLSSYGDCPRRVASQQYEELVKSKGYILRNTSPTAGSALGTATHYGVELMLRDKIENGDVTNKADALEQAIQTFKDSTREGAEWDELTPNINTANFQITRLIDVYEEYAKVVDPAEVELSLTADAGDGFELTGHVDLYTKQGVVRDLKTGKLERPYQGQLGAYSLLCKSEGYQVTGVGVDWLPRSPKTKLQEPIANKNYNLSTCEKAAWATIQIIKRDVLAFEKKGDAWSFPANPMTMMCSSKFCKAHGTNFCDMHD